MTDIQFAYPETVDEAVAILGRSSPKAIPVGGATALLSDGARAAELLVDVTRCGLDQIEVEADAVHIGAAVRMADLTASALPTTPEMAMLVTAAQGIGSEPLRHAITLGGNLMHLCAWADMPVVLLALDGILHVRQAERGAFDVGIDEIVETHPRRLLPEGSLITGVTVPLGRREAGAAARRGTAYHRFRATTTENPLITVGVLLEVKAGRCSDARVVVGAVIPRPRRARAAESTLVGTALDDETIARAAEKVGEDVACAPNFRMAQEVRARILDVMARRAIAEAAEGASRGGEA